MPLPEFSKLLSCFSNIAAITKGKKCEEFFGKYNCEPVSTESAIFPFQTIEIDGFTINLFFDSGCGNAVIKKAAIEKLSSVGRAKQVTEGPLVIRGVGGQQSVSTDGVYSVCLPLHNGRNAVITGLCLPQITSEFPIYDLRVVEQDINAEGMKGRKKSHTNLPKLPSKVGGETDILLGQQFAKYFPKMIFESETGLGLYESCFASPCSSRGVAAGPHPEFSKIERNFKGLHVGETAYIHESVNALRDLWVIDNEVPLLGVKERYDMNSIDDCFSDFAIDETNCLDLVTPCLGGELGCIEDVYATKRAPRCIKQFDEIEQAGTEVTYRCVDCRSCAKCKSGGRIDAVSIQEEVEQNLIEQCIEVDVEKGVTTAKLPFLADPDTRLAPNEYEAL